MTKLYKIKFIKDTELKKIGDIVNCSRSSAEYTIKAGYAEYIKEEIIKPKSKKGEKSAKKKLENKPAKKLLTLKQVKEELQKVINLEPLEQDEFLEDLSKKSGKRITRLRKQLEIYIKEKQKEKQVKIDDEEIRQKGVIEKEVDVINPKQILQEQSKEQELEEYKEGQINWINDPFWNTWDLIKSKSKKLWKHKEEYNPDDKKMFFLAHYKDSIKGRPQLIENVQKKIPLVRCAVKKEKVEGEEIDTQSFYFFDESYDKRYDGQKKNTFAMDFWMYRVISEDGKEYYILTQEDLPNEVCTFNGMLVELDDYAEMSKSMKIKSLSRIFFMKDFNPSVKILTPESIVKYTKNREITGNDWLDFLAYHPKFDSYNRFPGDIEKFKSAHLLSSKVDGYPLHLAIVGPQGTRKSKGYIETIAYKFNDEPNIVEGANSRIKGLSPSFKEKPANLGYLVNCNRMGWVDEIGKMIEFELNKHQTNHGNVLGELNSLLDHSGRTVVSGNDNTAKAVATSKFCFVLNPISGSNNMGQHVGKIDRSTMSRLLWWVQDEKEQEFVKGRDGIVRNPPTPTQAQDSVLLVENTEKSLLLKKCWGRLDNREEFLTLFDTCQSFLCLMDDSKVFELADMITQLARQPMKEVWESRSVHHTKLIIDGLIKHRCLFEDYDDTFTVKQEDYDIAERILIRMVKGWDTDLSIKKDWSVEI